MRHPTGVSKTAVDGEQARAVPVLLAAGGLGAVP